VEWFIYNLPEILTVIGIAMSVVFSGAGSATGAAMISKAAVALVSEQPEKFGKSLVLQMMSASQGLYGFIIGFLIFMSLVDPAPITFSEALRFLGAGSIMGLAGYFTSIQQSIAATAGMQILAKKPEHFTKGIMYSAMIETFAIFAFVVSMLILVM